MTTNFRIRHQYGRHIVESRDSNGVWVDPAGCSEDTDFATRREAEEYIAGWTDWISPSDDYVHDTADDVAGW